MDLPKIKNILFAFPFTENENENRLKKALSYSVYLSGVIEADLTTLAILEELSPSANNLASKFLTKEQWDTVKEQNKSDVIEKLKISIKGFCDETMNGMPECPLIANNIVVKIGNFSDETKNQAKEINAGIIVVVGGEDSLMNSLIKKAQIPVLCVPG